MSQVKIRGGEKKKPSAFHPAGGAGERSKEFGIEKINYSPSLIANITFLAPPGAGGARLHGGERQRGGESIYT